MRPLSMSERVDGQTVSLAELMTGSRSRIAGASELVLDDYPEEILASGLPGIRGLTGRARRLKLDGYLDRIVDREIPDATGTTIRNPAALRRWTAAYAAASSTITTFEKIRDAAALLAGESPGPSIPREGTLLGALFERLVAISVRIYSGYNEARIGHLRTARGRHEIDLIVERDDGRVALSRSSSREPSRTVTSDTWRGWKGALAIVYLTASS